MRSVSQPSPETQDLNSINGDPQSAPVLEHSESSIRFPAPAEHHSNIPSPRYSLRKGHGYWQLTFAGHEAVLKHEQGLAHVAYLLLNPPAEPMHAVELALNTRKFCGDPVDPAELVEQRSLGLDDAETLRTLRRREQELEDLIRAEDTIDPVREEALRELKEICDWQKKNPWRTRDNAQRCVRAVTMALKRLHKRLTAPRQTDPVLRAFADHIYHYILVPSGRGAAHGGARFLSLSAGCFTYEPPVALHWISN